MFRILVVDDETPIREWLVFTIQSNRPHFFVDSAQNGLEALQKCKNSLFDLVVMDIQMPHMNGLELLETLHETSPELITIVLSSYDDYNYVRKAFKYHAIDYLLKAEIDSDQLLSTLDHYYHQQNSVQNIQAFLPTLTVALSDETMTKERFLQELSPYCSLTSNKSWFCILLKFQQNHSLTKPYLPTIEGTQLTFCLPLENNLFLGCIECTTQPSTLLLMQTQMTYIHGLRNYNMLHLLLYSEIFFDPEELLPCLQLLWAHRQLDFYGISCHLQKADSDQMDLLFNKQYIHIIEELRDKHYDQVFALAEDLFTFTSKNLYPHIDSLRLLCVKLCESAYLNSRTLNLIEYHNNTKHLFPQFFSASSLEELQPLFLDQLRKTCLSQKNTDPIYSERISQAILLIEENYMEQISLASIADNLFVSPEYLSRSFKKQVGINFNHYLNNIRLQHALDMLKNPELPISEIAVLTGFQSPAYFSKCFKAAFGLSPQQWRTTVNI